VKGTEKRQLSSNASRRTLETRINRRPTMEASEAWKRTT